MADEHPMWQGRCPHCSVDRSTLDILEWSRSWKGNRLLSPHECFLRCRHCGRTCIFLFEKIKPEYMELGEIRGEYANEVWEIVEPVLAIGPAEDCPEHVPDEVKAIFDEGAKCLSMSCYDASGTMFRKVVDKATRDMLPAQPADEDKTHPDFIAWKVRKDLKLRLEWLLAKGKISATLEPLLESVREDGNDAAHATIGKEEAEDLLDFTVVLLETLYTLPGQIEANRLRREARRQGS